MSLLKLSKVEYSQLAERMTHKATSAVKAALMTEGNRAINWTKKLNR